VRTLALLLALASAAALGGCRKSADCVSVCTERDKTLKCGQTDCKDLCNKLHTSPVCGAELKSFETCLLKQPPDQWECDETHEPALKMSACSPERGAVVKCMENQHYVPAPGAK
jgi:hypothetical protein